MNISLLGGPLDVMDPEAPGRYARKNWSWMEKEQRQALAEAHKQLLAE